MKNEKRITVFLLSGDAKKILATIGAAENAVVTAFSEKQLTTLSATLKLLRATEGEIVFGTKMLALQRYRLVLKTLLFLSGKMSATIADESGERDNYSPVRFIFADSWMLLAEIIASIYIVTQTYLELESLKRTRRFFLGINDMTSSQSTASLFWTAFLSLNKSRTQFIY